MKAESSDWRPTAANDEYTTYAMLVRRENETLVELMTRLDSAVATAIDEDICIDEINKR